MTGGTMTGGTMTGETMNQDTGDRVHAVVVGAGGIGGWLAQGLAKLLIPGDTITLVDADVIEHRNIDRQLFGRRDVGKPKAEALAARLSVGSRCSVNPVCAWWESSFKDGERVYPESVLDEAPTCVFAAVDNHDARREVLGTADRLGCPAVLCGNEYTSADAAVYLPAWRETAADPRVYMPELLVPSPRDGLRSCTGEAQEAAPQLASANLWAASFALHLYRVWAVEAPARRLQGEALSRLPVREWCTWGRMGSVKLHELTNPLQAGISGEIT